jgi:hypothetical protein
MTTYSLMASCEIILRSAEEGQLFELTIRVLKDGQDVGGFVQRYGVSTTNADMRADIEAKVKDIVVANYDGEMHAALLARSDAISAALNQWTRSLP